MVRYTHSVQDASEPEPEAGPGPGPDADAHAHGDRVTAVNTQELAYKCIRQAMSMMPTLPPVFFPSSVHDIAGDGGAGGAYEREVERGQGPRRCARQGLQVHEQCPEREVGWFQDRD